MKIRHIIAKERINIQRFILVFITLSFFVISVGLGVYYQKERERDHHFREMALDSIVLIETLIRQTLQMAVSDIIFLSLLKDTHAYIETPSINHQKKLESDFLLFAEKKRYYDQIRIIGLDGDEVIRINVKNKSAYSVAEAELQNKKDRYFFKAALGMNMGDLFLSPMDLNSENGVVETPLKPILRIAAPLFNTLNQRQGVLILNLNCRAILDTIRKIDDILSQGTVYLLNSQGYFLVGPAGVEWRFMFPEEHQVRFQDSYTTAWQKIRQRTTGNLKTPRGSFTFSTVYPLSIISSAANAMPNFRNDLKCAKSDQYFWKAVIHKPLPASDKSFISFLGSFLKNYSMYFIIVVLFSSLYTRLRSNQETSDENIRKLSQAVVQSPVTIVITDKEGRIEYVNPKFSELTGYSLAEVSGKNPRFLQSGLLTTDHYKKMWSTILSGAEWHGEFQNKKKNGELFWEAGSISPIKNAKGKITHFVAVKEDITEKRQLESELKRLAQIPENNPNIVLETDLHGRITYRNPTYVKTFSHTGDDGVNDSLLEDIHTLISEFNKQQTDLIIDEYSVGTQIFERRIRYLEDIERISIYATEITLRKQAEAELKAAKENAERANLQKSRFLANISHEILTPLNAVLGFSELILEASTNEDINRNVKTIITSGKTLLRIINDIIDLSRLEAGMLDLVQQKFSFNMLIMHLQQDFLNASKKKNIEFIIEVADSFPDSVLGDEYWIFKMLSNVLSNAFKFTANGYVRLDCGYQNGDAQISVIDTGPGISLENQKLIFAPFQQIDGTDSRKHSGTGLGLAITKRLTEMIGGSVSLKSILGEGSKFTLTFPLPNADHSSSKRPTASFDSTRKGGQTNAIRPSAKKEFTVLLADDEESNQKLIKAALKMIGVDIDIAENGREALRRLSQKHYDCLLLDMEMPVMDGMETISNIRKNAALKSLHVIATTAHTLQSDINKILAAGCDDILPKPISIKRLRQKIKERMSTITLIPPVSSNPPLNGVSLDTHPIEKLPEHRETLENTIAILKKNCTIFDPQALTRASDLLREIPDTPKIDGIRHHIIHAAKTYNDESLSFIIEQLEECL